MEIWKDIPNYEWLYQASVLGRIKKCSRVIETNNQHWSCIRNINSSILKPSNHRQGYKIITLTKGNKRKSFMVHRLILKTFLWESELECNHKNWIKEDNRLENLEYCTSSENKIHAYNNWLMYKKWNNYKKY